MPIIRETERKRRQIGEIKKSSEFRLLSGLFFRLLPYQILLIVINAVNGIVDSLYASNAIENGKAAMGAIGLFGPFNHFLYAVRDNCSGFDPGEYVRMMEAGEEGRNIGIRLVYRIAADVRYQNLLGMNVLTIRI